MSNADPEAARERRCHLARSKGIDLEYYDIRGRIHPLAEETLSALLRALGVGAASPEEIEREIRREEEKDWRRLTLPVIVAPSSAPPREILFQFPRPAETGGGDPGPALQVRLAIEEEGGYQRLRDFAEQEIGFRESRELEGTLIQRAAIPFPAGLPQGRHQLVLSVSLAGRLHEASISVILVPERAYTPPALEGAGKRAGLMVALHGLRSSRNWGVGDFGDLKTLIDWAAENLGLDVIGLLPLHALANREPYNISPYYPSSRFYRNFIYLDVPAVEEVAGTKEIRDWIATPEVQALLDGLRESPWVEYEAVAGLKIKALRKAFRIFLDRYWKTAGPESARLKDFKSFRKREGEFLERYATFCALEAHFRAQPFNLQVWQDWPAPYRDPETPEVLKFREEQAEEVLFFEYLQWLVSGQLEEVQQALRDRGSAVGLYLDLALGIDPCGADAWAWQPFLIPGIKAGAPPDDFSPCGQDWGFRPGNRERNREDGYRVIAEELRRNLPPGGALRIDHVMKYFRLFWIPEGEEPARGGYVRDHFEDLVRVLALESVRCRTLIIGEDLGTVPDEVREVLQRLGVFSYRLFYFEKDGAGNFKNPGDYPEQALAAISTHDLPTLAGFWALQDIQLRQDLGLFLEQDQVWAARLERIQDKRRIVDLLFQNGFIDQEAFRQLQVQEDPEVTPELHRGIIGFLVSTPAKLVVLNQEDLFLEPDQQNLPGTTSQYPNWKRKMRYSLEQLSADPQARELAGHYREWIEKSGRGIRNSRNQA
ncbi:MAG: 4-alpha-glucanotransferase [Deltaproteobacteria bacterium]|nr:4-alpha-glucanotransferase [Deltaproteobacteria bacterium]